MPEEIKLHHNFKLCPDRDCHDMVEKADEYLFGEKKRDIRDWLSDTVSKTGVRMAMYASLGILLASFGTIQYMYAQSKDVPEIVDIQKENQKIIIANKERIAVSENEVKNIEKDIDDIPKEVRDVLEIDFAETLDDVLKVALKS